MEKQSSQIEDAYWVIPGKMMAGEYPGARLETEARARICWLLDQGMTLWVDLTEDEEYGLESYGDFLLEEARSRGQVAAHVRLPIEDMGIPAKPAMVQILNVIEAALKAGQTVYLHCFGGIGRTGTVVGCFLARHGITGSEAIDQIARWREGTPDGWKKSPETDEQMAMVMTWRKGE